MKATAKRLTTPARLLVAVFCWFSAAYAFVASSAFAYQQFIGPRVFPWLGVYSDWHAALVWPWLLILAALLWRDVVTAGPARFPTAALLAVCTAGAVWNSVSPALPTLTDGPRSIAVGIILLVPLIWLGVVDHLKAAAFLRRQRIDADEAARSALETRTFAVFIAASLMMTAAYTVFTSFALIGEFEPDLLTYGLIVGAGWNLLGHALIFASGFLVTAAVFRLTVGSFAVQYGALVSLLVVCLALAFERFVGEAIGLSGAAAASAAFVSAVSIVAVWTGTRARHAAAADEKPTSALDVLFGPPAPAASAEIALRLGAVVLLAYALGAAAGYLDWDFLLLKSGVLAAWLACLAVMYRTVPARVKIGALPAASVCVAPLVLYAALTPGPVVLHVLERYAVYNPGFRLVDSMLGGGPTMRAFDRYLQANSGLTDLDVPPVDIELVPDLKPSPARPKPLVFLFVVDSFRRDYLSVYNPKVDFTPRFAEFAAENVAFTNAFTRYGGTALSMAAMWAGSAIAHKQWPRPFFPMNPLEKLLDVNGYRKAFSRDHITVELLKPADAIELEPEHTEMQFDMCSSLADIERALQKKENLAQPFFAHTRSLNLHVWGVRNGTVPPGETYPGFHAPYATRVRRIDACFGRFVDFLKREKLYERSLIVFTGDHGELLGEDGRWGHSYHLFPPVVQVPLLMHLPAAAQSMPVDRHAVTFSIDIVPTIYSALGYTPERPNGLAGRTTIGATEKTTRLRRRGTYVLPASYGPVYAVLTHNGRRLYIADGINGGDQAWERGTEPDAHWSRREVTEDMRLLRQFDIRQFVDEVARTYHLPAGRSQ